MCVHLSKWLCCRHPVALFSVVGLPKKDGSRDITKQTDQDTTRIHLHSTTKDK